MDIGSLLDSFDVITFGLSGGVLIVLALISTRGVKPLWLALVFAVVRATVSAILGPVLSTAVGAFVVALALGWLFFWLLERTQGTVWWWVGLMVGVPLLSI